MPLISVVIPVYNRAKTLNRALKSVLAQTFQDFEIIVVDDGSKPPISIATNDKVRLIRHQKNEGAASARNTGIQNAIGEFVAFLDSDDEWLPEKLRKQIAFLNDNPSLDACTTAYILYSPNSSPIPYIPQSPASWEKHLLLGCDLGPGTTLMVRKSCFKEVGNFDKSLPRLEDLDWLMRFVNHYNLDVLDTPLAIVNKQGGPLAKLVETGNKLLIEKHRDTFKAYGIFYGRKAIAKRWLEIASTYYLEKQYCRGTRYLVKGLITNPFQRLGYYLLIFDNLLGTNIGGWLTGNKNQNAKVVANPEEVSDGG